MIPFINLKKQYSLIEDDVKERLFKVLEHGRYVMGPEIEELETKLADYCGTEYAVGCASGTDALVMGLLAYGIKPGDVVFTTPFTFIATAEVISILGAIPVFVDIDPKTYNIDCDQLEQAVIAVKENNPDAYPLPKQLVENGQNQPLRAKGIIPVDLFGQCADYERINKIADEHGLFVIEDGAQSFGGSRKGKKACSLAPVGCTSFFPAKPLGCYGDAGAVFTSDKELHDKLLSIRVHGYGKDKYTNVRLGITGRMDSMQAAVLLAKMPLLEGEMEARQKVAASYTEKLRDVDGIVTPEVGQDCQSAWAQYSLRHHDREKIQKYLGENQVPTAIYYPIPLHLQEVFAYLGYKEGDMPVSEKCSQEIFSLPFHPYLEEDQIAEICALVKAAV